jgi:hypothetical protein
MRRAKPNSDPTAAKQQKFVPVWSKTVPLRLAVRIAALTAIALLAYPTFASWLQALLLLAAAICVCVAEIRREQLFASEFTHWDEAAAYGLLIGVVTLLK